MVPDELDSGELDDARASVDHHPTQDSPEAVASRGRSPWPLVVVAAIYLVARIAPFVGIAVGKDQDTLSYLEVARLSPLSAGFLGGPRGWTVPLFYKIVGDDSARIYAQLGVSILCWLILAGVVAHAVSSRRVAIFGFAAILLFSLSSQIVGWDSILLSESLSFSLGVALVAAWLWLVRVPRPAAAAAVVALSLLWAFARDSNAYLVLLSAVPVLLALKVTNHRRLALLTAGALVAIFALTTISVNGGGEASQRVAALNGSAPGNGTFGRTAQAYTLPAQQYQLFGDGRWEFPLLNVIGSRVLTDAARLSYFRSHGMPVNAALLRLKGGMASSNGGEFYRSPELADFRHWLQKKGQGTYATYLVTHPLYTLRPLWSRTAIRPLLFPASDLVTYGPPLDPRQPLHVIASALPGPVQAALLSSSAACAALWLLAVGLVLVLVIRRTPRRVWVVPVTIMLVTLPHFLLVWHGDAQDPERHGLSVAIFARLGVILMIVFALDSPRRASNTAGPARQLMSRGLRLGRS